jgi:hypothetical protein
MRTLIVGVAGLWVLSACASATPVTNECPVLTGTGTTHDGLSADETWTVEASPHLLPSGLSIPEGVTLTLGPCAVVKVGDGHQIGVAGKLVSAGTATRRVTITALDATKPWTWIDAARTTARPALDLASTDLSGGGKVDSSPEFSSMVRVRGDQAGPMIRVNDVSLTGSASVGLIAVEAATFTSDSHALTITGSALEPMVTNVWALTSLPDGTLAGNGDDEIGVKVGERLGLEGQSVSVTLHKRSVPYRFGTFGESDDLMMIGPPTSGSARLVIEPGAVVGFAAREGFSIEAHDGEALGAVVAQGTADAPILFTSGVKPQKAGDWSGLLWMGVPTADTVLDHVVIEYAGYPQQTVSGFSCGAPLAPNPGTIMGALRFASDKPVTTQMLTHSVIRDSGSNGVDRGWSGADVDYLATNTFQRITWCTQTENRDQNSQCPVTPSCPTAP